MHRLNHILTHLSNQSQSFDSHSIGSNKSNKSNKSSTSIKPNEVSSDEITSLDVFTIMDAILNGGKGGGINETALRDETKLRKVFNKLDLDSSGDLDRREFAIAARLCSMVITESEIDTVYTRMAGQRGTITFKQFKDAISSLVDQFHVSNEQFSSLGNDKKIVIALWDQFMNGNKRASDLFTNILIKDPNMNKLENVDLDRQVHMVFAMVGNAFRGLVDEQKLIQRLEKEGQRHFYTFKLTDKHYNAVENALLQTLPAIIGHDYTFYAQMQFEKYWGVIKGAMIKGFNDR